MEKVRASEKQSKGGYRQINKALNICAFEDYLEKQLSRLPELPDVQQLSPRVLRVLGQNAGKFTLQGTNTYIVGTGSRRLIIDTGQGIPEWASLISATLARRGITLTHVLLTHWHGDHTGGVPDLIRLYPHLEPSIYKHTPSKAQRPLLDGQVIQVEGATVRVVHSPGHSHDHCCFLLEEEKALFTGDNVLGHGSAAVEQLSTWMGSLRKMQAVGCTTGYPAHGEVVGNLPAKIEMELGGKARREKQVLQALSRLHGAGNCGGVTLQELVAEVYGDQLDDEVRKMAIEPLIEEVLRKLAEDGKVAFRVKERKRRWLAI
ncbi:beta-lactamase-like protein [Staphylotrichum tortipilum]|uniref:Beta-lactamase-like protein n=1 Tax=Staphylotrichum tortipilum TaxID=2831512 RepID=A0AAN6MDD8_9PEZI|nr:beta-lactamase-like protein [Staphylotrichum longicolle]